LKTNNISLPHKENVGLT